MVKKIANYITKYCYVVFVVFLVLAGICAFLATKVNINHDIYSYMPANSETSLGLNIMKDEFDYGKNVLRPSGNQAASEISMAKIYCEN